MADRGQFFSLLSRTITGALTMVLLLATVFGAMILTSPTAHAQTFSVIHTFDGLDGSHPQAGVTIKAGILWGTTVCLQECGGPGTVYQISPIGSKWATATISFLSAGGDFPIARVLFGPDNHLYGTTTNGGPQGNGVVFNLTPPATICKTANCFWAETVLHQFTDNPDGAHPGSGDLVWDPMGNIYGTTESGGTSGLGTVYQMTKSGNNWTEMPIYSFTELDGQQPYAGIILDGKGNLFGTTSYGGLYGFGTIFEVTYNKGSGWTETVLYSFQNLSDGQWPFAGLISDSAGNLYGATTDGGSGGGGTVFELSPVGDTWDFTLLYSFSGQQGKNCGPWATLTMDGSSNLYGTTKCSGANSLGNVFKLTNTQNGWEYTSLHDFTGGADGANPLSNVTFDMDGNLYGSADVGGGITPICHAGCGTVWMIKP